jgi:hypothetical protein
MLLRTAKSCGPDAPTLASSFAEASRPDRARTKPYPLDDGDNKARSPGRARRKPLKPLRAGMPGVPVRPWRLPRVLSTFAHEAAGAAGTRHSPRPLFSGRKIHARLGRIAPRDREVVSGVPRHCEERLVRRSSTSEGGSDEAIHSSFTRRDGLLRCARNDARAALCANPLARNDGSTGRTGLRPCGAPE